MRKKGKISKVEKPAVAPLQCQTNPPPRILVVDADGDVRQLSAELLQRCGYAVDAAEDAATAWRALNTFRYDLVITDHAMLEAPELEQPRKFRAAHMAMPMNLPAKTSQKQGAPFQPWLQPAATLLMPYTVAEFVGTVRDVLRAAKSEQEPAAPPPEWAYSPPTDGGQTPLQL